TLVHDTQRQHTQLVQLTDELDETKTASLCSSGNIVVVREHGSFFSLAFWPLGKVDLPSALEFFLAAVEEILPEESTTHDNLAVFVLNAFVSDLWTHILKHALAELGVHGAPMSLVASLLECELNDLAKSTAIGF